MNTRQWFFTPLGMLAAAMILLSTAHGSTNDRQYKMGEDDSGSPGDGTPVDAADGTFDSEGAFQSGQLHDLIPRGGPVYRTISGRPDGGSGLGIEFNGNSSQYLLSARFGLPDTTPSSINGGLGGTLNYNGLVDRGFQFWVQPTATGAQSLVSDTTQHVARINSDGNFSMHYAGADFDSTVAVVPSTWYHVMVVRPNGAANGARMYVDGIAVAAAPGGYDGTNTADLVVGSNTGGDDGSVEGSEGFTGGTEEFFSGIIDDLEMFVIGDNSGDPGPPVGQDYGSFDFAADNAFAAFTLSGVPGDVNNSGGLDAGDVTDFVAGWMNENLVNDIRVGDLNTYGDGDLNSDGITDINDLVIMQSVLPTPLQALLAAKMGAVPEPSTGLLVVGLFTLSASAVRRRGR